MTSGNECVTVDTYGNYYTRYLPVLFLFQTISSDSSAASCSQTEKQVCSNITARLASNSQLISSCSTVCCTTSKCNGKDPIPTTVSTESMVPSTTASTKGTLRVYLQREKKLNECIKSLLTELLFYPGKITLTGWRGTSICGLFRCVMGEGRVFGVLDS